ncbi:hypothetical protein LXL04_020274 [Taraxacum kok-saghyz]
MSQLLDAIVKYVPPTTASLDEPFQMLVHGLRHSDSGSSKLKMEKRENFELSVSPPKVMYKIEKGVNEEHVGMVMEALSHRRAEVTDMGPVAGNFGRTRMTLTCPSRLFKGLVGYRSVFSSDTRGTGFMHRAFLGYSIMRFNPANLECVYYWNLGSIPRTSSVFMTTNKAQGQTIPIVGVYYRNRCSRKLYVALSRRYHAKIQSC